MVITVSAGAQLGFAATEAEVGQTCLTHQASSAEAV